MILIRNYLCSPMHCDPWAIWWLALVCVCTLFQRKCFKNKYNKGRTLTNTILKSPYSGAVTDNIWENNKKHLNHTKKRKCLNLNFFSYIFSRNNRDINFQGCAFFTLKFSISNPKHFRLKIRSNIVIKINLKKTSRLKNKINPNQLG